MEVAIYNQAKYDETLYVLEGYRKKDQQILGIDLFMMELIGENQPVKPNEDFFRKEKADQSSYPDPMVKQRENEQFDETDFISQPLLPSIKKWTENLHAMNLEKDVLRNKTTITTIPQPEKKVGFEGKFL